MAKYRLITLGKGKKIVEADSIKQAFAKAEKSGVRRSSLIGIRREPSANGREYESYLVPPPKTAKKRKPAKRKK
ncbi:MAG: hypothetical protein HY673_03300 [Chloroflexi bacterium]|nr:hypothetical protein [Chloroflexota bacterium]